MNDERYYVKYLQLDSELEFARIKIRNLEKEIQELKIKLSLSQNEDLKIP